MDRMAHRPGDTAAPAVEWRPAYGHARALVVRSHEVARQVLSLQDATVQAGFKSEEVARATIIDPPMLYTEGETHREQRRAAARHFTPRTVSTRHSGLIADLADEIVDRFEATGSGDVDTMAFRMAMRVVTAVLGMTGSDLAAMERLLDRYFRPDPPPSAPRWQHLLAQAGTQARTLRFHVRHVRPEIKARRRVAEQDRPDDVISALVSRGQSDLDILGECLMYAAAGMVTTRQLMTMTVWHLLVDDALRARYLAADQAQRIRIIQEVLRLEPVGGTLLRHTTRDLELDVDGDPLTVPAGTLVDIEIRAVHLDARAVGADPGRLDPDRTPAAGVGPSAMAFGHGHHSCPGEPLALVETEAFVSRLLHDDAVRLVREPVVEWNDVALAYHLTGLEVVRT